MYINKIQRIINIVFVSFILLVIVILGWRFRSQFTGEEYRINRDQAAVVKQMQELSRLETASFTIEKIIDASSDGNIFKQVLFGDRLLLITHGEVIAGFDLSAISEDNVTISEDRLSLRMPAPEILVVRLDNDKTRVYDRRQGLLTTGDKDLETQAR